MIKAILKTLAVLGLVFLVPASAFSYEIPKQDAKTKYFYIFGPGGSPLDGKESDEFHLFVDVPASETGKVTIKVMDPDTVGELDAGTAPYDTDTEFTVKGSQVLDQKTFGQSTAELQAGGYTFGPYEPSQGEKRGEWYRFSFTAKTLRGDDMNVFFLQIKPETSEAWSDKFTFILRPNSGERASFYPEIPAGINKLIVRNFDLDEDGGISSLHDLSNGQSFQVQDSTTGKWAETEIAINAETARRLEYRVTTTQQKRGHAGIQFLDDKGDVLPIYFRKGRYVAPAKPVKVKKEKPVPAPAPKNLGCNQYVFDARRSYDPDKADLTYSWDFGDGTSSSEAYVVHTYEKGGNYRVTLTVSDNSGLRCEKSTTSQQVDVNTPPQAALTGPDSSCVGREVSFDAGESRDDSPANMSYRWSFGDGSTAEGAKVTKTYEKGGVYEVGVNVDDNAGTSCSTDAARRTIRINTPPVAKAGKPVSVCLRNPQDPFIVSFDGTGSHDADKDALSYAWDFGDGATAEGARVQHEYKEAGDFKVKLLVSDNSGGDCSAASDSIPVKLNKAPVALAGKDQYSCAGSEITLDASGSQIVPGTRPNYRWDFGDGQTAEGEVVKHSYQQGGVYKVSLTVDDGNQTDCSQSIDALTVHVNGAPSAALKQVETACAGDKVTLDASGSSDPDGNSLKYSWDFGDGTTFEGGSKVTHKYEKGGSYNVRVTVNDGSGGSCAVSSQGTSVKVNTPPKADAGPNLVCCEEDSTAFDGSKSNDPDGDSLSYNWNFGDGGTSSEARTEHAYSKSGTYKVSLTVDDGSGTVCSSDSSSFTANVNSQPVPVIEIKQK